MTDRGGNDVISADQHQLSPDSICGRAREVVEDIQDAGFEAYIVGGGVRDLLLGFQPKDFDIATNAEPEQVKGIFRRCRLIGRRFRLAHVRCGRELLEVATFRGDVTQADDMGNDGHMRDGRIIRDNVFGSRREDAFRRDFTINALFYDPVKNVVIDHVEGFEDLKNGYLRLIGEPADRYREDPVRMLRAARFEAKLPVQLAGSSRQPMADMGHLLADIAPARLFEEVLKLFQTGHALASLEALERLDLLRFLFPETVPELRRTTEMQIMVIEAMKNTDERVANDQPITPAFLYAVMLWPQVRRRWRQAEAEGKNSFDALHKAISKSVSAQLHATSIPRRFSNPMRDIWLLQPRFSARVGKKAFKLFDHPRFRAAYDFLLLRAAANDDHAMDAEYWTEVQEGSPKATRRRLTPNDST